MPYATHWKCHNCQQVLSYVGYVECPFCHHRKCGACGPVAVRRSRNCQPSFSSSHGARTPSSHHIVHTSSNTASTQQSQLRNQSEAAYRHLVTTSIPNSSHRTDVYSCCQCDSAGPQVWQVNPMCSSCGHIASGCCYWYK